MMQLAKQKQLAKIQPFLEDLRFRNPRTHFKPSCKDLGRVGKKMSHWKLEAFWLYFYAK